MAIRKYRIPEYQAVEYPRTAPNREGKNEPSSSTTTSSRSSGRRLLTVPKQRFARSELCTRVGSHGGRLISMLSPYQ
eukprot:1286045-Rhodomonas_salina.1